MENLKPSKVTKKVSFFSKLNKLYFDIMLDTTETSQQIRRVKQFQTLKTRNTSMPKTQSKIGSTPLLPFINTPETILTAATHSAATVKGKSSLGFKTSNQDSFLVLENIPSWNISVYGVFDGHGGIINRC